MKTKSRVTEAGEANGCMVAIFMVIGMIALALVICMFDGGGSNTKHTDEEAERDAYQAKQTEEKQIAEEKIDKDAREQTPRDRQQSSGSAMNGYTWRGLSYEARMIFCNTCAARVQSRKPGITGQLIFDSLQEFYTTTDPKLLSQPATDIAALTIAAF